MSNIFASSFREVVRRYTTEVVCLYHLQIEKNTFNIPCGISVGSSRMRLERLVHFLQYNGYSIGSRNVVWNHKIEI